MFCKAKQATKLKGTWTNKQLNFHLKQFYSIFGFLFLTFSVISALERKSLYQAPANESVTMLILQQRNSLWNILCLNMISAQVSFWYDSGLYQLFFPVFSGIRVVVLCQRNLHYL